MQRLNFDNLTNIEVPESLIKSALDVPNQRSKPKLLPVRFYRFAAGIAACVVIAAAVIISLMFGINKNVDLTAPDPGSPSQPDQMIAGTTSTSVPDVSAPSTIPPLLSGEEAQSGTSAAEPAESTGGSNLHPQDAPQAKEGTAQAPEGKTQDKSKQKPVQTNTQPPTSEQVTQQPTENAPQTEPGVEPTTEDQGDEPIGSAVELWFATHVDSRLIEGEAYCRLVDENGNVLGNKDYYDSSRRAYESVVYNNRVGLYLTNSADLGLIPGKTYTVIFYDSEGRLLKQGSVLINPNETIVYFI